MKVLSQGIVKEGNLVKSPPLNTISVKRWHERYFILYDPFKAVTKDQDTNDVAAKKTVKKKQKSRGKSVRQVVNKLKIRITKENDEEEDDDIDKVLLLYYENKKEQKNGAPPLKKVLIENSKVSLNDSKVNGYKFVINLETAERLFYLCAENKIDRDSWFNTFKSYIDSYGILQPAESKDSLDEFLEAKADSSKSEMDLDRNSLLDQLCTWKDQRGDRASDSSLNEHESLDHAFVKFENSAGNKDSGYSEINESPPNTQRDTTCLSDTLSQFSNYAAPSLLAEIYDTLTADQDISTETEDIYDVVRTQPISEVPLAMSLDGPLSTELEHDENTSTTSNMLCKRENDEQTNITTDYINIFPAIDDHDILQKPSAVGEYVKVDATKVVTETYSESPILPPKRLGGSFSTRRQSEPPSQNPSRNSRTLYEDMLTPPQPRNQFSNVEPDIDLSTRPKAYSESYTGKEFRRPRFRKFR